MEEMELKEARQIFINWLEHIKAHKDETREADKIMAAITAMLKATKGVNKDGV